MLLKLNNIDTLLKYSQIIYLQFVYCIFLMLFFSHNKTAFTSTKGIMYV